MQTLLANYPHGPDFSYDSFTSRLHESNIWDKDKYWILEKDILDLIPLYQDENIPRAVALPVVSVLGFIMSMIRAHYDQNDCWMLTDLTESEIFELYDRIRILQLWFFEGNTANLNTCSDQLFNPLLDKNYDISTEEGVDD